MNRETEKMAQEQERATVDYQLGGAMNMGKQATAPSRNADYDEPLQRTPIRQRIENALYAAQRANRKAEAAQRAYDIIEAHPEFAELLDALDRF